MGNTAWAHIVVEIENNGTFCGGGKLKGRVLLDVREEIPAESLIFRFYGRENTRIKVGDTYVEETADIYSAEVILQSYDVGSVALGSYAFPFEVELPRGLPGSQSFEMTSCKISYHCEAELYRPEAVIFRIKNTCEVLMNDEPNVSILTPMFLGPISSKVSSMCSPRGVIMFGGKVNTTDVCGNEKFRLDYGIYNSSTARVKALTIEIRCNMSFEARGHNLFSRRTVFRKRIEAAKLVNIDPINKNGDGAVDTDFGISAVSKQIEEGEFNVDIPTTYDIISSHYGTLITVKYELFLSIKTTFGTNNHRLSIPITMYRCGLNISKITPGVEKKITLPSDWNPIQSPTTFLPYNESVVMTGRQDDTKIE